MYVCMYVAMFMIHMATLKVIFGVLFPLINFDHTYLRIAERIHHEIARVHTLYRTCPNGKGIIILTQKRKLKLVFELVSAQCP